jgi:hypothetical protein
MEKERREKLIKRRQRLLDLLNLCEWDLILEKYKKASYEVDEIKKIMDELIGDLIIDALN